MKHVVIFRLSVAIMPRDSMPESKVAIMSRLRDMNQQLAAIDKMSNNMEREFKNTRLVCWFKQYNNNNFGVSLNFFFIDFYVNR